MGIPTRTAAVRILGLLTDLLRRYLDAEVTACDHHAVSQLEDLVEALQTLVVLDLGDDLDAGASLAEHVADRADAVSRPDERREHHVHLQAARGRSRLVVKVRLHFAAGGIQPARGNVLNIHIINK